MLTIRDELNGGVLALPSPCVFFDCFLKFTHNGFDHCRMLGPEELGTQLTYSVLGRHRESVCKVRQPAPYRKLCRVPYISGCGPRRQHHRRVS